MCKDTYTYVCVNAFAYMFLSVYIHIYVFICKRICIHVCVYVYVCTYIYKHDKNWLELHLYICGFAHSRSINHNRKNLIFYSDWDTTGGSPSSSEMSFTAKSTVIWHAAMASISDASMTCVSSSGSGNGAAAAGPSSEEPQTYEHLYNS